MARSILVIVLVGGLIAGAAYWASTMEEAIHHGAGTEGAWENLNPAHINGLALSRVGEQALNCPFENSASTQMPVSNDSMQTGIDGKPIILCFEPGLTPPVEKLFMNESCVDSRIRT